MKRENPFSYSFKLTLQYGGIQDWGNTSAKRARFTILIYPNTGELSCRVGRELYGYIVVHLLRRVFSFVGLKSKLNRLPASRGISTWVASSYMDEWSFTFKMYWHAQLSLAKGCVYLACGQSTACEQQNFEQIIAGLDTTFLLHLALGK